MKSFKILFATSLLCAGLTFSLVPTAQADCPNGNIQVRTRQGQFFTMHNQAGCCYTFPACKPCNSDKHYNKLVGEHIKACGEDNKNRCNISQSCKIL